MVAYALSPSLNPRLLVPGLAVLAGIGVAAGIATAPGATLDAVIGRSHLADILPQAAAPIGVTGRSLIALAVSAWVKWRIAAGALLLGIFVAGAGFGTAVNQIVRTDYGSLVNLPEVMYTIWAQLLWLDASNGLPVEWAWGVYVAVCAACLWLLWRKVRAFEVVK